MATPGTCGRKFPGGRLCGKPTPDTHGMYIVVNKDAYAPGLCRECERELRDTFLAQAPDAPWRARPPEVAPDGSLWDTGDVRKALELSGHGALVGKAGPLNSRALERWWWLMLHFPDLLERVRHGEVFDAQQQALILERVRENRGELAAGG